MPAASPVVHHAELITIPSNHNPLTDVFDTSSSTTEAIAPPIGGDHDRVMTVVHVDDEPDFAEVTKAFLERIDDDLTVITEHRPADVLDRIESADIDAIISDYQMPRMDGIELLEAVRVDHPNLPFILCTARGSEEVASEAIAAGVTDYIQKRTDTEQYEVLANRLTNAIERYRTRDRLWESLSLSAQLMEQSLAGVYIAQDNTFTYVNAYFAELFGHQPADLIGEPTTTLALEDTPAGSESSCLGSVPPGSQTARYACKGQTRTGVPIGFEVEVRTTSFYGEPAVLGVVTERAHGGPQTQGES